MVVISDKHLIVSEIITVVCTSARTFSLCETTRSNVSKLLGYLRVLFTEFIDSNCVENVEKLSP